MTRLMVIADGEKHQNDFTVSDRAAVNGVNCFLSSRPSDDGYSEIKSDRFALFFWCQAV